MNDSRGFDRAVARWLDDGSDTTPPEVIDAVLLAVRSTPQERDLRLRWRAEPVMYLRAAVVIAIVVVAGAAALYALDSRPNVGSVPSPNPTVQPTWTGPLRTDPQGAVVALSESTTDPEDAGDAAVSWADITNIDVTAENQIHWYIDLAGRAPAAATDAGQTIIAYGLVLETNGDGSPDYVVGIDNDAPSRGDFRVWVTNLQTGATDEQLGPPYGFPVEFAHPDEDLARDPQMVFTFLPGSRPPGIGGGTRFYAWASVTEGDEVVAWDYAPDAAWLGVEPAEPLGCEAAACPISGPSSMPAGSRQLVASVENDSEEPALLFVAQDEGTMGELVGTASPPMLAAGMTSDVVFTVPPGREWAIFVNPTSATGPLVTTHDVPGDARGHVPFTIEIADGVGVVAMRGVSPGWFGN